jgi:undecaprenyl-phosphate alpha-N-acetylglucosaminyl 1-phosphatetransferase
MLPPIFSGIFALFMTIFALYMLRPLAVRLGLVDKPGGRKLHQGNVPLIGGIAMFLGFAFSLLTLPISLESYRSFIAAAALLVWLGVLDDFHEISAVARLVGQLIAALLITAWGGQMVQVLGNLFSLGAMHLGNWSMPFSVIAIIGVINAFNMLDGIDGLAASVALIELILLLLLAWKCGRVADGLMLLILIHAVFGFWCFNFCFPQRKQSWVFMGDAGSMFLGVVLAWFLISLSQQSPIAARPVTMLWFIALPLFDAVNVVLQRLIDQRSPWVPDRRHLHHLLQAYGWNDMKVVRVINGLTLATGLFGYAGEYWQLSESFMFVSFLSLFAAYVALSRQLWKNTRSLVEV